MAPESCWRKRGKGEKTIKNNNFATTAKAAEDDECDKNFQRKNEGFWLTLKKQKKHIKNEEIF